MKIARCVALMAIGGGAVVAYQKYNKPVMRNIQNRFRKATKEVDNQLEHMM